MSTRPSRILGLLLLSASAGCSLFPTPPSAAPPLRDLEEPLELFAEPDDEVERQSLALGCFAGLELEDARDTLEAMLGESGGVRVARVVENSPADAAGLLPGDLVLEAQVGEAAPVTLSYPSQWREIELGCAPGALVAVVCDRANRKFETKLQLEARLHLPGRHAVRRVTEDRRAGLVLRTATEVEARRAGLGPGGGAVVVGLSRASPWRSAGIGFGDLLIELDGVPISDPNVVLNVLRETEADEIDVVLWRGDRRVLVRAPLSWRAQELQSFSIPLVFSYSRDRDSSSTSALFYLYQYESTPAAWQMTLFWILSFGGGDADALLEVDG